MAYKYRRKSPQLTIGVSMSDTAVNLSAALDNVEELLNAQKNAEASEELSRLAKEEISQPEELVRLYHLSGVAFSRLGKMDDAIIQFRRSRAEAEKVNDQKAMAQADEYLGSAYHQRNRLDEARFHYSRALSIWTELGDKAGQGRGHRNMGNLYVDANQSRAAMAEYDDSCKFFRELGLSEEMAPAIMHRATMAYGSKGLLAALEVYKAGIEEEKCHHYLVLNNYGFMLMLNSQVEDGMKYLKQSMEEIEAKHINDDDLALVCLNIGVAYALTDSLEEAEKYLRRAAELLEAYPQARAVEFLLQANDKYRDKGFSKYLIVENGQKKSLAHLNLAAVLAWSGKIDEAKEEVAKGVESDCGYGYPYLSAGWVYLTAGMQQEAAAAFYRACGFEPNNEEFRKALSLVNPYAQAKVGRNDPCPCGSGKKFKKCHGINA